VKPIGGVIPKIKAAKRAGAKKVIIPKENMQSILKEIEGIDIIPVTNLQEVFDVALVNPPTENINPILPKNAQVYPHLESM
jgi:ATP-dependent Lon protease